ncbi:V-set and immunoglobulin domain-containing protein 2-like isoform X1 [Vespula maculifrons]|uniref:V-set and immunoglobulin domain-containing protein 2-like isoform X1 n=1 Tax=Vespula maculifrons TaxID=7453 RepID=A0ABD2BCE3_VESMC
MLESLGSTLYGAVRLSFAQRMMYGRKISAQKLHVTAFTLMTNLKYAMSFYCKDTQRVTGLKDLTINVPAMVRSGDTVILTCTYDLEGSSLYSIQWSLEEVEFYRYVTERMPPQSAYNVSGIHVNVTKTALKYNVPHVMRQARKNENKKKLEIRDALSFDIVSQVTASDTTSVTLVDVSRNLTGTYKCEVSAGVPSYHTLIERAKMMVVDAPKTDPTIGSEKERIAVGEMLRANCTSGASRPASAITWMLNGDHITSNSSHFWIQPHSISQEDDTVKTKSHIEFKITNDMFQNGRLHLRCIAFISDVYRKSADMEIAVDEPLLASITGDAPAHSHSKS